MAHYSHHQMAYSCALLLKLSICDRTPSTYLNIYQKFKEFLSFLPKTVYSESIPSPLTVD